MRHRQIALHRRLAGREQKRAFIERDRLAVFALLGECRAASGNDLPVRLGRIVGHLEQAHGEAGLPHLQCETAVLGGEVAVAGIVLPGGLQDGERLFLLVRRFQVAGVVDRGADLARGLGVLLAPVLECLFEFVLRHLGLVGRGLGVGKRERLAELRAIGAGAEQQGRCDEGCEGRQSAAQGCALANRAVGGPDHRSKLQGRRFGRDRPVTVSF